MNILKITHFVLGFIPFAWLLSFLLIITIGIMRLGYIPKYGNPIDPYALGIYWLGLSEFILALMGVFAFITWPLLTLFIYIFFKNKRAISIPGSILFMIGVCGFLGFRYCFTDVFLWVID